MADWSQKYFNLISSDSLIRPRHHGHSVDDWWTKIPIDHFFLQFFEYRSKFDRKIFLSNAVVPSVIVIFTKISITETEFYKRWLWHKPNVFSSLTENQVADLLWILWKLYTFAVFTEIAKHFYQNDEIYATWIADDELNCFFFPIEQKKKQNCNQTKINTYPLDSYSFFGHLLSTMLNKYWQPTETFRRAIGGRCNINTQLNIWFVYLINSVQCTNIWMESAWTPNTNAIQKQCFCWWWANGFLHLKILTLFCFPSKIQILRIKTKTNWTQQIWTLHLSLKCCCLLCTLYNVVVVSIETVASLKIGSVSEFQRSLTQF